MRLREAFKLGSPALRVALVRGLAAALRDCAAFLGARCVIDCTAALLTSAADGTPSVRAAALQAWAEVSETLRSGQYSSSDAFMNVTDGLGEKYMAAVKNASAVAALGNDSKLRELLATVLGVGAGLQGRLLAVVRLGDNTKVLVRCAGALLAPEPSVCSLRGVTASVLETRRYCWTRVHSGKLPCPAQSCLSCADQAHCTVGSTTEGEVAAVEAGYHRVAWRGPQEADCRDLAHRTVLSIGRNGETVILFIHMCVALYTIGVADQACWRRSFVDPARLYSACRSTLRMGPARRQVRAGRGCGLSSSPQLQALCSPATSRCWAWRTWQSCTVPLPAPRRRASSRAWSVRTVESRKT